MTTIDRKAKSASVKKKAEVKPAKRKVAKSAASKTVGVQTVGVRTVGVRTVGVRTVGVRELRQNASKILDMVKAGAIIEVTEHGEPVARLAPIKRSLFDEYIESGLIRPAENPNWRPHPDRVKIKGLKTSTEILLEMRAEERF
jgi:prevent-host-death family protein